MIDVFQDYAKENGAKILVADALMLIATAGAAMYLKSVPLHFVLIGLLGILYALCFILFTAPTPTVAQAYQASTPISKAPQGQEAQPSPKQNFQEDRRQGLLDPGSFDPRQLHTPFDPQGGY
jgi:cell division protein FtsW (lipid II flippase)